MSKPYDLQPATEEEKTGRPQAQRLPGQQSKLKASLGDSQTSPVSPVLKCKEGQRYSSDWGEWPCVCKACATKTTEIPKSPFLPSSRQSHDKKMAIYKSRQTPNMTLTPFISDFPTFRSIQNKPVLLVAHPEYSLNKQTRYK